MEHSAFHQLKTKLAEKNVTLVAVSKTKPVEAIMELYQQGQRVFGENRVQELVEKYEALPKDIEWHLIGHLQSNKVKYIVPFVGLIHSVDSVALLEKINSLAQKQGRTIDCLLQVHIAQEETKFGFDAQELEMLFKSGKVDELQHVRIRGLMGMATFTDNATQVRQEFHSLRGLFNKIKSAHFPGNNAFDTCSMGMSGDYELAVEEGSTMVRIGSLLFGARS
ncbi:MAG: YggS family pyridoxal phosphate-dependent enzyme [Chitinophagales bacterium]|nr:YggS family pyridoxal phosphate-dependent enzyme [Chitinophagales bacterium]